MLRSAQLQGLIPPLFPIRKPNPRHDVQLCSASANVSDLVHSIVFVFFLYHPFAGCSQVPVSEYRLRNFRQPYIL